MELDLEIANEISQQMREAADNKSDSSTKSSKSKAMIARRQQKQAKAAKARISDDEAFRIATGQV
jgi:hypothetical protein